MDEKFEYDLVPPESSNIPGPAPDQRHAQPSGPWPWQDIEALGKKDTEVLPPLPPNAPKWRGYPQVSCLAPIHGANYSPMASATFPTGRPLKSEEAALEMQ